MKETDQSSPSMDNPQERIQYELTGWLAQLVNIFPCPREVPGSITPMSLELNVGNRGVYGWQATFIQLLNQIPKKEKNNMNLFKD